MQQRAVMNLGSDISSSGGLIHEIFNGGSNRQRRLLLPVIAFLVMIALCLPVLLVYESNEEARRAIIRRSKKQHLHALLFPADTNAGSVRGHGSAAAVREAGNTHSNSDRGGKGEKYDDVTINSNMDPLATLLGPREGTTAPPVVLPPYTFANVLHTIPRYHDNIAILIYDPASDKFIIHYSTQMKWVSGCRKLITSLQMLSNSLRLLFPTRFGPNNNDNSNNDMMMQDELALSVSSGDFPSLRWNDCLRDQRTDCNAHNYNKGEDEEELPLSPILHFGSVFQTSLVPTTTYAMPMPQYDHLHCFHYWTMHQQICEYYLPKSKLNSNGLVFGKSLGLSYDTLIPQVIWRGTDFSYLSKLMPQLRRPNFDSDILSTNKQQQQEQQQQSNGDEEDQRIYRYTRNAAIESMRLIYNELIPRWKGVVWTAEAERDAQQINNAVTRKAKNTPIAKERQRVKKEGYVLPWCNIKFASTMYKGNNTPALEVQDYTQFNMYGIPAAGESMDLETLATYKYHIDIGGGGGTTWSGTLEKLAMPGLLFHHVTPTKDYFHDLLVPYVHYIPIKDDLSDLRDKYEWAEIHPQQAKQIANAGTALVKSFGTVEGFMALYHRFYEEPLRQVVEAYVPLRQQQQQQQQEEETEVKEDALVDWQTAMVQLSEEKLRPIMQCGGYYHHDCERLVDDLKYMTLN